MSYCPARSKQVLGMATRTGYLGLPLVYWHWLLSELESGAFPTNSDSIGIPMAGFLFLWILIPTFIGGLTAFSKLFTRERRLR